MYDLKMTDKVANNNGVRKMTDWIMMTILSFL